MEGRKRPSLVTGVFALALVLLVLDTGGGPGWGASSAHVVLAARFEHLATSPLYDLLASAFTLLPVGEPGFRVGLLGALLGACTLAGVVAAARALVRPDPAAGAIGAVLLLLAPPVRDAAAFASPGLLAAAGLVWAVALAARYQRHVKATATAARAPGDSRDDDAPDASEAGGARGAAARDARDARDVVSALLACGVVIGAAPWLGALVTLAITGWLARAGAPRSLLAAGIASLGLAITLWWFDAAGSLPGLAPAIGAGLAAAGQGAAAIVLGAGLVGTAFGVATLLPRTRGLALVVVAALAHEALVGGAAPALLAVLAVGAAIIPSALVRVLAATATGLKRHAITLAAGAPLVGVAALTGATFTVEDPGATPAQLAHDLVDALPPGDGVFVATRRTTWLALNHEMTIAGARPDLALVPPLPVDQADAIVAHALRGGRVAGADAPAFGRLDIRRAIPRGRGFQLVGEIPPAPATVPPPASYATATGAEQAILLALARARHEAASGRLDAAARAAGLEVRFGAADLAVLGATAPSATRPALFGFLPLDRTPLGPWVLDTFGDDLAWVAGIAMPAIDATAPVPRRLQALWRDILAGARTPEDPEIAVLGEDAVRATQRLFQREPPPASPPTGSAGSSSPSTSASPPAGSAAPPGAP